MRKMNLRVLEEGALVVGAAPSSVEERLVVEPPGALHHGLLPGLMDAQVGCVDEPTQDEVCEVSYKVLKCHPGGQDRKEVWMSRGSACLY